MGRGFLNRVRMFDSCRGHLSSVAVLPIEHDSWRFYRLAADLSGAADANRNAFRKGEH